jgi:hypothetical protein
MRSANPRSFLRTDHNERFQRASWFHAGEVGRIAETVASFTSEGNRSPPINCTLVAWAHAGK